MRKRSARTAALSLSTITLASSLAFPIYAEASEDSESLVSAPESETVVDTPAKEEAAVDNADEFSSEESVDSITPAIDAAVEADLLDESFLDQSNEIDNETYKSIKLIIEKGFIEDLVTIVNCNLKIRKELTKMYMKHSHETNYETYLKRTKDDKTISDLLSLIYYEKELNKIKNQEAKSLEHVKGNA